MPLGYILLTVVLIAQVVIRVEMPHHLSSKITVGYLYSKDHRIIKFVYYVSVCIILGVNCMYAVMVGAGACV